MTAKEFLEMNEPNTFIVPEEWLIEFAKIHVEKALKSVYNTGLTELSEWEGNPYTGEGSDYLSFEKILKAYPLENIK